MSDKNNSNIFRRDVSNWSTYQDRQLRVLGDLEKSFKSSLNISKSIEDSLSNISRLLNTSSGGSTSRSSIDYIIQDTRRVSSDTRKDFKDAAHAQKDAAHYLVSKTKELFLFLGNIANNWSAASNEYMKVSGMRSDDVYRNRSEFTDMISDLNKSTGYLFNALDSYKTVLSMTQNITGDLGAVQEMSRPLLLASETIPGDLSSIAETFNRFYVRYGFNSQSMESVLDSIRKNTAGNTSTSEDIDKAINQLSVVMQLSAKGDTEVLANMSEQISNYVSHQAAMGLNPENATKLIQDIMMGTYDNKMAAVLNMGGLGNPDEVRRQLYNGELSLDSVGEAYRKGVSNIVSQFYNESTGEFAPGLEKMLANYGLNFNDATQMWMSTQSWFKSNTLDDFINKNSSNPTMAEIAEGKYASAAQKAENFFSSFGDTFAKWQEMLGIGITDIVKLLGLIAAGVAGAKTISAGVRGISSLSGLLGGAGGAAGLAGLGSAAAIGGIVTAAVAATAALGYTAYRAYDHYNSLTGNAEEISNSIEDIGESLKQENEMRLAKIADIEYQFIEESDVEKRKNLIIEAGLATREELEGKTAEQLKSLIESYRNAALRMEDITEGLMRTADKYYSERMDSEQSEFTERLLGITDSSQRKDILQMLELGITDEKTLAKLAKFDGSDSAWKDIIYGGKNAWFDKNNLQDISINTSSMQLVANALGWGMNFTSSANTEQMMRLTSAYLNALTKTEADKAWEEIESSGLKEDILSIYGDNIESTKRVRGYAVGTNYVTRDQLALVHEGEEITPKKYNFAASGAGILKEVLDNMRESTDKQSERYSQDAQELIEEIKAIKEFMRLWKSSQDIESMRNRGRSPIAGYNIAR